MAVCIPRKRLITDCAACVSEAPLMNKNGHYENREFISERKIRS